MNKHHLLTLALCCYAAGCGARSAMLSFDDAQVDGSTDAIVIVPDQLPDAPQGCVHPPVTKQCSAGWCAVPAGCYVMGSPKTEPCREPPDSAAYGKETAHEVTLTHGFEIQQYEATQTDFKAALGYTYHYASYCGMDCPVVDLTWDFAAAYCNALSAKQGLKGCYSCSGSKNDTLCKVDGAYKNKVIYSCPGYRLPTEAEWEYAYRAGTTSAFYSGPMASASCNGCSFDANLNAIGWYCYSAKSYSYNWKVGSKAPNAWGLHDMAGNAWEWCHDGFVGNLGDKVQVNPVSSAANSYHVHRGGGSSYRAKLARAAVRGKSNASHDVGVRCVRSLLP
jgi:formylglycine-generating enzyme required for sulfatase activity